MTEKCDVCKTYRKKVKKQKIYNDDFMDMCPDCRVDMKRTLIIMRKSADKVVQNNPKLERNPGKKITLQPVLTG